MQALIGEAREGLEELVISGLRPGSYLVRLYFAEPDASESGSRSQDIRLQGKVVLNNFDIAREAGGIMKGMRKEIKGIAVSDDLTVELSAVSGKTLVSGIELIREY